jgi:hypothetical protein
MRTYWCSLALIAIAEGLVQPRHLLQRKIEMVGAIEDAISAYQQIENRPS